MSSLIALRFDFRVMSELSLGDFLGSKWRSVFLNGLYHGVCMNKRIDSCQRCFALKSCGYAYIFDNPTDNAQRIPPYAIKCGGKLHRHYAVGDTISVELVLWGRARDYLPFIIHSVRRVYLSGHTQQKGDNLELVAVACLRDAHSHTVIWQDGEYIEATAVQPYQLSTVNAHFVDVDYVSPLRMMTNNQVLKHFDSEQWYVALAHKLKLLDRAYPGEMPAEWLAIEWHDIVMVDDAQMRFQDWSRHSGRQGLRHKAGGLIGKLKLRVHEPVALQALQYLSLVGVGKLGSLGLGQFTLSYPRH